MFDTQKSKLEYKVASAMKGKDTFQDVGLNHWRIESNICMMRRELTYLGKLQHATGQQLGSMERGGGCSFWPKTMLHPSFGDANSTLAIHMKPCKFCKSGYMIAMI